MSTGKKAPEIVWDEYFQNWPGRLAWVEARITEGRIPDGYQTTMDELKTERERLVAARDEWARHKGEQ